MQARSSTSISVTLAAASCGTNVSLAIDGTTNAQLRASTCTSLGPAVFQINSPFAGPQPGGTYFYDRYIIQLPAGSIVRFDTPSAFPGGGGFLWIFAFTPSGAYVAHGVGGTAMVINNASAVPTQYQIVVRASIEGATGTYSIRPTRIL